MIYTEQNQSGQVVPVANIAGASAYVAIGAASARVAMPTSPQTVRLSCTADCWVKFGDGTVTALTDGTSVLLPAPGEYTSVPSGATHVAVIGVDGATGHLQVTRVG